jgi:hypothetical protein
MGIQTKQIEAHWNYLLSIEGDLETLSRFVELHQKNFECFSIELSRLLMAAASEVDVVCKQFCKIIDPKSRANSINEYQKVILKKYNSIPSFSVIIPRYGLTLQPWQNWGIKKDHPPLWWTAYNKIKHHRHTHYHNGNLKNALNAIAGLFIMVLYFYRDKAISGELFPALKLLHATEEHFGGQTMGSYEFGINYRI